MLNENIVNNISAKLDENDWNVLNTMDVDTGYDYLISKITESLNEYSPEIKKTINNKFLLSPANPWMTNGLITSMKRKNKLYRKAKGKSKDTECYKNYTNFRNLYNRLIKQSKKFYYDNEFSKFKNDSKTPRI